MEKTNRGSMRYEAHSILQRLPEEKLQEALSYLRSIDEPEDIEEVRKRKDFFHTVSVYVLLEGNG